VACSAANQHPAASQSPDHDKRRYELAIAAAGDGKPTGPSPADRRIAETVRLQEELDAANAQLRRIERGQENLTKGRDWTWQDDPKDIAAAWFRLQPTKAVKIASKLLQLAKSTTPKPSPKKPAGSTASLRRGQLG
jgi:hypothetical protein